MYLPEFFISVQPKNCRSTRITVNRKTFLDETKYALVWKYMGYVKVALAEIA